VMLVELRARRQTASRECHDDGDAIVWKRTVSRPRSALADWTAAVRRVAAVGGAGPRWRGTRTTRALALAGLLASQRMECRGHRRHFVEAVAASPMIEWQDRSGPCTIPLAAGVRCARNRGRTLVELPPERAGGRAQALRWLELATVGVADASDHPVPINVFGDARLVGSPDIPLDRACGPPSPISHGTRPNASASTRQAVALTCRRNGGLAAVSDQYVLQPRQFDSRWTERPCLYVIAPRRTGTAEDRCHADCDGSRAERWNSRGPKLIGRCTRPSERAKRIYQKALDRFATECAKGRDALEPPDRPAAPGPSPRGQRCHHRGTARRPAR